MTGGGLSSKFCFYFYYKASIYLSICLSCSILPYALFFSKSFVSPSTSSVFCACRLSSPPLHNYISFSILFSICRHFSSIINFPYILHYSIFFSSFSRYFLRYPLLPDIYITILSPPFFFALSSTLSFSFTLFHYALLLRVPFSCYFSILEKSFRFTCYPLPPHRLSSSASPAILFRLTGYPLPPHLLSSFASPAILPPPHLLSSSASPAILFRLTCYPLPTHLLYSPLLSFLSPFLSHSTFLLCLSSTLSFFLFSVFRFSLFFLSYHPSLSSSLGTFPPSFFHFFPFIPSFLPSILLFSSSFLFLFPPPFRTRAFTSLLV
ncbi:unnamed protein product [Acanthosepion pharaonis]|uniref:Uncharacterized protein n=1 Tax=Acanthosepion pharaonis TaxID=158019 RepID=A0A812ERH8_ACAPH|nr:unnamed protein product [Sepia pharaonis]